MRLPAVLLAVVLGATNGCQRPEPWLRQAVAWETAPSTGNSERLPARNLYLPEGGTGSLRDPAAEPGPGQPTGMVVLGPVYAGEPRGAPGAPDAAAHQDFQCGAGAGRESCVVVVSVVAINRPPSQHEYLDISLQGLKNGIPTGPKATAVHRGNAIPDESYRLVLKQRGPVRVAVSTREDQVGPDNPAGIQTVFTAELADYSP